MAVFVGLFVLVTPLMLMLWLQMDMNTAVDHNAEDDQVESGNDSSKLRFCAVQLLVSILRPGHLDRMAAQVKGREERVDSIEHMITIKVLSAELMSARIVIPDLIADDDGKNRKQKFAAVLVVSHT